MRRRGEWRARKWLRLENRNWKLENRKRVAARRLGVPFFVFWRERREKFNAEFAEDAEGAEKRGTEILWT